SRRRCLRSLRSRGGAVERPRLGLYRALLVVLGLTVELVLTLVGLALHRRLAAHGPDLRRVEVEDTVDDERLPTRGRVDVARLRGSEDEGRRLRRLLRRRRGRRRRRPLRLPRLARGSGERRREGEGEDPGEETRERTHEPPLLPRPFDARRGTVVT